MACNEWMRYMRYFYIVYYMKYTALLQIKDEDIKELVDDFMIHGVLMNLHIIFTYFEHKKKTLTGRYEAYEGIVWGCVFQTMVKI